jgi:hypothetical protein
MPPLGKEEPSGSPCTSSLPVNSVIAVPSPWGEMKPSCFSAVELVSG